MRTKLMAPIAALALAAAAATAANATTTITSTFDAGTEGWTFGTYTGVSGQPLTWDPATQTVAKINHGFGQAGFFAPSAYLGDKSAYLGGSFSFDLSASSVDIARTNFSGSGPARQEQPVLLRQRGRRAGDQPHALRLRPEGEQLLQGRAWRNAHRGGRR